MTDIDFINNYYPDFSKTYEEIKNFSSVIPMHTLTQLRDLISQICLKAGEKDNQVIDGSINDKIKKLFKLEIITADIKDLFHQIRIDCNKGAHPSDYKTLSENDFKDLAIINLEKTCNLLNLLNPIMNNTAPVDFHFIAPCPSIEYESQFCYKAIFEADYEAQYKIGILLQEKALVINNVLREEAKERDDFIYSLSKPNRFNRMAFSLFNLSSENNFNALYEYGLCFYRGLGTLEDKPKGLDIIEKAASKGCPSAQSFVALHLIIGDGYEKDIERAIQLFEEAAGDDDPSALTMLGRLYREGKLLPVDMEKAKIYTEKAAVECFPPAQYDFGILYLESGEIDKGLYWLQKAVEQGNIEAKHVMAQQYLEGRIIAKDLDVAEKLYKEVLEYNPSGEIFFELYKLYRSGAFGGKDLFKAGHCLQSSYEKLFNGDYDEIIDEILIEAYSYVEELREVFGLTRNIDLLPVLALFDKNKRPYPNQQERINWFSEITFKLATASKNNDKITAENIAKSFYQELGLPVDYKNLLPNFLPDVNTYQGKFGRNERCPCGSGLKYKKCCGLN